jgi:hypothetical protein
MTRAKSPTGRLNSVTGILYSRTTLERTLRRLAEVEGHQNVLDDHQLTVPTGFVASAAATRIVVAIATSGFSEIESIPSPTSHTANSG